MRSSETGLACDMLLRDGRESVRGFPHISGEVERMKVAVRALECFVEERGSPRASVSASSSSRSALHELRSELACGKASRAGKGG